MDKALFKVVLFIFTLTIGQAVHAGSYSIKCDDYAAVGYASKDLCLKDGRWHLVYEINKAGAAIVGNVNDLDSHVQAGADFKITVPMQNLTISGAATSAVFNGSEKCQSVYRAATGNKPFYCLSPLRFQGEADAETSHGSVRYSSEGRVYCNGLSAPGGNGCSVDAIALKWFIKY